MRKAKGVVDEMWDQMFCEKVAQFKQKMAQNMLSATPETLFSRHILAKSRLPI